MEIQMVAELKRRTKKREWLARLLIFGVSLECRPMIILDYLAYQLSVIILPMWKVLLHAFSQVICRISWAWEWPTKQLGKLHQVGAKSPDFSKPVGGCAEYSDELSWVVSRKTTFETFWATIHQPITERVGHLTKAKKEQHFNLLKWLPTSEGRENNEATYSLRERRPSAEIFVAIHSIELI